MGAGGALIRRSPGSRPIEPALASRCPAVLLPDLAAHSASRPALKCAWKGAMHPAAGPPVWPIARWSRRICAAPLCGRMARRPPPLPSCGEAIAGPSVQYVKVTRSLRLAPATLRPRAEFVSPLFPLSPPGRLVPDLATVHLDIIAAV